MKKLILCIMFIFLNFLTFAQITEPEIIPLKQPFIIPKIDVFGLQFGVPISNFFLNFQTDVNLTDKISAKAMFSPSVWDMQKAIYKGVNENQIKTTSAKEYVVGFELTLFTKKKLEEKKLIIRTESSAVSISGSYTLTKYYRPVLVEVPTHIRLRGGLQGYQNNVHPTKFNTNNIVNIGGIEWAAIKASDGTIINNWKASNVNTLFVYGGISFKRVNYFQVKFNATKEYGEWRHVSNFFLDVMFAPIINIGKVQFANTIYDVNNSYIKQRFGFRIGKEVFSFSFKSKATLNVTWEAGMLPGVGKFPVYAKCTFGIAFNVEKTPVIVFN